MEIKLKLQACFPEISQLQSRPVVKDICQFENKMRPYRVKSRVQFLEGFIYVFTPSYICHTSDMELHKGTV